MLSSRINGKTLLLIILIFLTVLRIVFIEADPPRVVADLSGSAGIYFDESIYAHNARNKILFGEWVRDDFNPLIYNPLLTGIYYLVFKLTGVGIIAVKSVSICFGIMALLFFWLIVKRLTGEIEASAWTMVFGLDYFILSYNRIGILENFNLLFFLMIFFFFIKIRERESWIIPFAVALMISLLSKYLYLFYFLAALIVFAIHCWNERNWKLVLKFTVIASALFLTWYLLLFLSFSGQFRNISAGWGALALPSGIAQAWLNLKVQPFFRYLGANPLILLGLLLFFAFQILELARLKKLSQWNLEEIFVFLWILGGVLQLGILNYRPLRYYLPIFPALYLALVYLANLLRNWSWKKTVPLLSVSLILCLFFGMNIFRGISRSWNILQLHWEILLAALVISFVAILFFRAKKESWPLVITVLSSLMIGGVLFVKHSVLNRSYNLKRASLYFESRPGNVTVIGQEALRLNFDTTNSAFMAYETWFNANKPVERFNADYLVVLNKFNNAELGWILKKHPYYRKWLEFERRYRIWDSTLTIYRISVK